MKRCEMKGFGMMDGKVNALVFLKRCFGGLNDGLIRSCKMEVLRKLRIDWDWREGWVADVFEFKCLWGVECVEEEMWGWLVVLWSWVCVKEWCEVSLRCG